MAVCRRVVSSGWCGRSIRCLGYLLLLTFLLAGCGPRPPRPVDPNQPRKVSSKFLWQNNNEKLTQIRLGMTREEVLGTMGNYRVKRHTGYVSNPLRADVLQRDGAEYEILYYEVKRWGAPTPVLLKNNSVVGWGQEAIRNTFPVRNLPEATDHADGIPGGGERAPVQD